MWIKTEDGSVIDAAGKVMYFSVERFIRDICLGPCCFICGASPEQKRFNDEHVLPEWLLRKYGLFAKAITLPNGVTVRYDRYTVPCCEDCNAMMGEMIERPISEVVQAGQNALLDFIASGQLLKVFVWMSLIYLKTHLKDRTYRVELDRRRGDAMIADQYDWSHLHHLHCMVRCFYTGCYVEPEVVGSFLALPVRTEFPQERFDFFDLYHTQSMLMRLGDTGLVTVFNDSGGSLAYFAPITERITGPVSEIQLREIMVNLACLNLHLRERPVLRSDLDSVWERGRIVAIRPDLALSDFDMRARGAMLHNAIKDALTSMEVAGLRGNALSDAIKSGSVTFLFDDQGAFITQSLTAA